MKYEKKLKFGVLLITRQHVNKISLIGLLVLLISSAPNYGEIPAFSGAKEYGAMTTGGSAPLQRGNAQVFAIHNFSKQVPNSNSYSFEITSSGNVSPVNPILDVYGNIRSTRLKQTDPQWHVGKGYLDELLSETFKHLTPWPTLTAPVMITEMGFDYFESIMLNLGALKSFRDAVDTRLIGQDLSGKGQIIDVVFPDDFITFKILSPPTDSDNDRMPNQWETANNLNSFCIG